MTDLKKSMGKPQNGKSEDFSYFLYGTDITDAEFTKTIEDIFNNGLINYKGNSMSYIMKRIPEDIFKTKSIKEVMQNHFVYGRYCFLIKIPKDYLYSRKSAILPFWKFDGEKGEYNRDIMRFTNKLIRGVLDRKSNKLIDNINYSPIYDPTGLIYDESQIDFLAANLGECEEFAFCRSRNGKTYSELAAFDNKHNTWGNIIKRYNQKQKTIKDISFEDVEQAYNQFWVYKDAKGEIVVENKFDNSMVVDESKKREAMFAHVWNKAGMHNVSKSNIDAKTDYHCFNDGAEKTYNYIKATAIYHIKMHGQINLKNLMQNIRIIERYKHSKDIVESLFSSEFKAQLINDYFRDMTPNAKEQTEPTMTYEQYLQSSRSNSSAFER